ncbi:cupin domain-containing protein [Streptomyces sp. NPDC002896]|uniref:cupin domain-containing protein n=1 Tax=Streptomyces sp. NPDC002896 TaxID=3154438 RepID=UPI003325E8DA
MTTTEGAILKVQDGAANLPSMNVEGSKAFIGDAFANPAGAVICSGFFELFHSEPLVYEYTYDETKFVVEGEFTLTDMATGQVVHAAQGDVLFFPKGTTVKFETPDHALGFYAGHRSFAP